MQDIAIVLVIVLIVVIIWRGPKTLPLLGKAFGQGVKEARKEIDGIKGEPDARSTRSRPTATTRSRPPPDDPTGACTSAMGC